uniref:Immunoglobulin V-set domain-containing protein n=1 Tax=Urocitellus parryii TaxID=9999 RepID=A0A8D2KGU4_UROPR
MGTRLLFWVGFCLLGTGSVDDEVILSPRHLIRAKGGKGTLKCYPMSGHISVFCYQQAPGQGPQFLVEYFEKMQRDKGKLPDGFSAQQFDDNHSELNMSSLELGDSATYLCASSLHSPAEPLGSLYPDLPVPAEGVLGRGAVGATQTYQRPPNESSSLLTLCLPC